MLPSMASDSFNEKISMNLCYPVGIVRKRPSSLASRISSFTYFHLFGIICGCHPHLGQMLRHVLHNPSTSTWRSEARYARV